ncbi:MAG TPA: hypothetical protein RMH99_20075 [Sandaracinaceae bacterium LLY-WYZ-13_1]|nr:hypothetical protein [Sandaracinaceae bacterium LLY-WYZ-13_1]
MTRRWTIGAAALGWLLACGEPEASTDAGAGEVDAGPDAPRDGGAGADGGAPEVAWPNEEAPATSDPWIVAHHDEIALMRPRVLALNFVNRRTNAEMEAHVEDIFAAIREATRPHGEGAPFLEYELARAVDLTDESPPADWPYRNSTRYPREDPPTGRWGFDYGALFGEAFAAHYGFEDPDAPGEYLTLCELSERGLVHEVWVYGDADVPDVAAAEILAFTPEYDASGARVEGAWDTCAGNGCFDSDDFIPETCTRTLRIGWVNHTRGVGCYLESIGHGIEGLALRNSRPYLQPYFRELAGFDLDDRYGLPVQSWYECTYDDDCLRYPTPSSVEYTDAGGFDGTIDPYDPICGNAHWPPNARRHYDVTHPGEVLTTCRDWRRGSDGGEDRAELVSAADWAEYEALAPDCTGAFAVWWWQSFPSVDRQAIDDDGQPMHNWWPYLFY